MTALAGSPVRVARPRIALPRTVSPFALATGLTVSAHQAIGLPDGPGVTAGLCVLLLLVGMPHGSFDIALLREGRVRPGFGAVLAVYLALGALTLAAWVVTPILALMLFVAISVVHFAEDWVAGGVPVLAAGVALSLFAAPAIANPHETARLFVALSGERAGAQVADLLILMAPSAFALGVVGMLMLWRAGHRRRAVDGAAAVAAMLLLPPLFGFALFFCLFHSPLHFRDGLQRLSWQRARRWLPVAAPVTLAALGIAAALFALAPPLEPSLRLFSASFLTLAVLTVPHMLAPPIIARLRRG